MVNIKNQLKQGVLLGILFSAVFWGGFYVVNFAMQRLNLSKVTPKQAIVPVDAKFDNNLANNLQALGIEPDKFQDWARTNNLKLDADLAKADPDQDGLLNYLEYAHGTDPNVADTDKDGYSDKQELVNGYDPDDDGKSRIETFVQIEKIGVDAPMVWSKVENEQAMLKDLENGVNHFPETSAPGQNGNMIISGHSSNFVWSKGDFNYVFKRLNDLQIGDLIKIKTVQKNGQVIVYEYKIKEKFVTKPDDERVFAETEKPTLTLSTCWPLGTNFKRLIVQAEL